VRPARRAVLLGAALLALAAGEPALPPLDSPLLDAAQVLAPAQRSALEQKLRALERDTGHRVVVHTARSLEGVPIDDYAESAARQWLAADGVLLIVAPAEQRARLRVGPELDGRLPSPAIAWILQNRVLEEFRRGDLSRGIERGVDEIDGALRGGALSPAAPAQRAEGERSHDTLRELGRSVFKPEAERTGRGRGRFFQDLSLFGWILVGAAFIASVALRGGRLPRLGETGRHGRAMRSRVVDRDGLYITHARKMGRGDGTW
jgi:uncharacterized membrane protein YgcG